MKGKILISLLALGATSAVFANGAIPVPVAEPAYFDGIYLGLGGGVQHQSGNLKNSITDTIYGYDDYVYQTNPYGLFDFTSDLDADIGDTSINGEIFAGYGKTFNATYYAGLELFARYAKATPKARRDNTTNVYWLGVPIASVDTATTVSLKSDFSYGGALKFGYLITPKTMIYVLAGVESTNFDVDVDHDFEANTSLPLILPAYSYGYGFDKNAWAFVPGIGVETMLSDRLSLSAQYTYADYGNTSHRNDFVNLHRGDPIPPIPPTPDNPGQLQPDRIIDLPYAATSAADDRFDLSRGLFTLRLTYRFNGI